MNTIDITPIANAAIALIAAIVSVYLIPWIRSKTTNEQRKQFVAWVKIAVSAAEQVYNGPGRGEEKKQYVIDFLKAQGMARRHAGARKAQPARKYPPKEQRPPTGQKTANTQKSPPGRSRAGHFLSYRTCCAFSSSAVAL